MTLYHPDCCHSFVRGVRLSQLCCLMARKFACFSCYTPKMLPNLCAGNIRTASRPCLYVNALCHHHHHAKLSCSNLPRVDAGSKNYCKNKIVEKIIDSLHLVLKITSAKIVLVSHGEVFSVWRGDKHSRARMWAFHLFHHLLSWEALRSVVPRQPAFRSALRNKPAHFQHI